MVVIFSLYNGKHSTGVCFKPITAENERDPSYVQTGATAGSEQNFGSEDGSSYKYTSAPYHAQAPHKLFPSSLEVEP